MALIAATTIVVMVVMELPVVAVVEVVIVVLVIWTVGKTLAPLLLIRHHWTIDGGTQPLGWCATSVAAGTVMGGVINHTGGRGTYYGGGECSATLVESCQSSAGH